MSASARDRELIRSFSGFRVLVIGDLILDRYVWGSTERISPEAPVPVVRVDRESTMLGGAGNVARNLSSLGAQVELVSLTGGTAIGKRIANEMGYKRAILELGGNDPLIVLRDACLIKG